MQKSICRDVTMINSKQFDEEIAEDSDSVKALKALNSLIIAKKKFIFDRSDLIIDLAVLVKEGVVVLENEKVKVISTVRLSYIAFLQFQSEFELVEFRNLNELFDFLDRIDLFFDTKNFQGRSQYIGDINTIGLFVHFDGLKESFEDFVLTWKREPGNAMYLFAIAYGRILPFLVEDADSIFDIVCKILLNLEFDKKDVFNLSIIELYKAINQFAIKQSESAKKMLSLCIQNPEGPGRALISPIVSGLLSKDIAFLDEIEGLSRLPICQEPVTDALSRTELPTKEKIKKAISIVSSLENDSIDFAHRKLEFFISVIQNGKSETEDVGYSLGELRQNLLSKEEKIWHHALRMVNIIRNKEEKKTSLLIEFIQQDHFDKNSIPTIGHIFFDFEECKYFFDFLTAYATKWPYNLHDGIFNDAYYLRDKRPVDFDVHLIDLMIHDLGNHRLIGSRLFGNLSFHQGLQEFSYDVNMLPPIKQFRLLTAILEDVHEPKYTIPFILPLLNSESDIIVEILISRFELLADDFGSAVTKVLIEKLDLNIPGDKRCYDRVEERMLEFASYLKLKNSLKDLNPWYSESKQFNYFIRLYQHEFGRKLSKHVDKNSIFMQFASTVILAKGGGWKHPRTNEVSQLGKFESSFSLPRSYYVSPDNFEFERKLAIVENWSELFNEWEAIL